LRTAFIPLLLIVAATQVGCAQSEAGGPETSEAELVAVDLPEVMVFKSPTCGCCSKWVEHMQEAGFEVKTTDLADMRPVKEKYSVPANMASCHTALVGGYVVEGHVPAEEVKRMLEEEPDIAGIAVPGMPVGSPGMEQGDRVDSYDILTFDAEGNAAVFASR